MFILYIMIGKQIIHPIEHIAQTMDKSTTNQLGPPLTDIRKNEIGKIEKSYNRMISNIEHLLTENELQMQKTYEAELKSLELQINPHFIFNTLDTINWTAVQEGAMDVSEMLTGLAAILRYTVYGINQVIPLKSDIDWIHQYLELQKIRFHNKFSYDLFIQARPFISFVFTSCYWNRFWRILWYTDSMVLIKIVILRFVIKYYKINF